MSPQAGRRRLMIILGTRPEAVKLAPVILEARRAADQFDLLVVATGQHRQMLDQVLRFFGIRPDVDLDIMSHDQDLCHVTTQALDWSIDMTADACRAPARFGRRPTRCRRLSRR